MKIFILEYISDDVIDNYQDLHLDSEKLIEKLQKDKEESNAMKQTAIINQTTQNNTYLIYALASTVVILFVGILFKMIRTLVKKMINWTQERTTNKNQRGG